MTTRTLAILTCVAASALLASPAHAKRKKAAAPAAATEAPPTEEGGTIAPGGVPEKTTESAATAQAEPAASPAEQKSEKAAEEPAHAEEHPALKMEAPPPLEAPAPAVKAPPRKSNGNADSPEGVTWRASGWDVTLYGYAALNMMQDSTQSFGTASSNTIIQRRGTPRGNNGQAQATARDSRIGLRLAPPTVGSVRASVNIETDFNAPPPIEYTEASAVTQAGLRMRHYYMKIETPVIDVIAGQYHDLFGWGGKGFYPSTLAFLGITGEIYHRKPQLRLSKTLASDSVEFEIAGAALAPVQKNGRLPRHRGRSARRLQPVDGSAAAGLRPAGHRRARPRRLGHRAALRGRELHREPEHDGPGHGLRRRGRRVHPDHPGDEPQGSRQLALVHGRVLARHGHLRHVLGSHGRHALPVAAELFGSHRPDEPAARLHAEHRQRHRDVRR